MQFTSCSIFILLSLVCLCHIQCFTLGYHPPLIIKGTKLKMIFEWETDSENAKEKMVRCIDSMSNRLATIRASGANPVMLDRVKVQQGKSTISLSRVAKVQSSGASTLLVDPFDKTLLEAICLAISNFDGSLTARSDGTIVKVTVPPLTEERRKELVAQAKAIGNEGKIALRSVRHDIVALIKAAEKGKLLSKDNSEIYQKEMTKMVHTHTLKIDDMLAVKEKDLMRI